MSSIWNLPIFRYSNFIGYSYYRFIAAALSYNVIHALRDRAEIGPKRRGCHGANQFEGLPRTFRTLRPASGEGGD